MIYVGLPFKSIQKLHLVRLLTRAANWEYLTPVLKIAWLQHLNQLRFQDFELSRETNWMSIWRNLICLGAQIKVLVLTFQAF